MNVPNEISTHGHRMRVDAELYRGAFDASPALMFLTDARASILDANEAAAVFLNMDRQTLRTKPLVNFVARSDTREFRRRSREVGALVSAVFVAQLRPRHGRPRPMVISAAHVPLRHAVVWVAIPLVGRTAVDGVSAIEGPAAASFR